VGRYVNCAAKKGGQLGPSFFSDSISAGSLENCCHVSLATDVNRVGIRLPGFLKV
jgi:hypothetical protein